MSKKVISSIQEQVRNFYKISYIALNTQIRLKSENSLVSLSLGIKSHKQVSLEQMMSL